MSFAVQYFKHTVQFERRHGLCRKSMTDTYKFHSSSLDTSVLISSPWCQQSRRLQTFGNRCRLWVENLVPRADLSKLTESCSRPTSLARRRGQLDSRSTRSGCIWWWWLARKDTTRESRKKDETGSTNSQEHTDSCKSTQKCHYWELQHGCHCLCCVFEARAFLPVSG